MKFWRIVTALAMVLPAAAALLALFLLLPAVATLGCAVAGMVLFKVAADFGWNWSAVIGGTIMMSGVFAWAIDITSP